jgi:hypothetical protein
MAMRTTTFATERRRTRDEIVNKIYVTICSWQFVDFAPDFVMHLNLPEP